MATTFNTQINCAIAKPQPSLFDRALNRASMLSYERWVSGMSDKALVAIFTAQAALFVWALLKAI